VSIAGAGLAAGDGVGTAAAAAVAAPTTNARLEKSLRFDISLLARARLHL
jgi:hypothetical protein